MADANDYKNFAEFARYYDFSGDLIVFLIGRAKNDPLFNKVLLDIKAQDTASFEVYPPEYDRLADGFKELLLLNWTLDVIQHKLDEEINHEQVNSLQ